MKMVQNSLAVPQNDELPCDPANPLLGIHPRAMKTHIYSGTCTGRSLQRSLPVRANIALTEAQINKTCCVQTHTVGLFLHKKECGTEMPVNLKNIMPNHDSQTQKRPHIV